MTSPQTNGRRNVEEHSIGGLTVRRGKQKLQIRLSVSCEPFWRYCDLGGDRRSRTVVFSVVQACDEPERWDWYCGIEMPCVLGKYGSVSRSERRRLTGDSTQAHAGAEDTAWKNVCTDEQWVGSVRTSGSSSSPAPCSSEVPRRTSYLTHASGHRFESMAHAGCWPARMLRVELVGAKLRLST